MSQEKILAQKVLDYNPNSNSKNIQKAVKFAKKAHTSQTRASGEPYFTHPIAVANILAELKLDDDSIITGLLHDTVEDTVVTRETIRKEFGENVAKLVDGVTKLNKIEYQPENVRQAENFRKLLLAMSEDIRILLIKICDRLHNMRTINHISSRLKRIRIAQETLEIYTPLTERIGVHKIRDELQDLAFAELNEEVRNSIIQRLDFLQSQGNANIVEKIIGELRNLLIKNSIDCKIYGRTKKPYSIWQKMKLKNVSFEQLSDIMAFRVIVNDMPTCYHVLGIIHEKFHSIPGTFKDYISTPKENGYKSLHTTVIGPGRQKIEVQIRTEEMHDVAEYGIAAHWRYKQKYGEDSQGNYRWIGELLNILENSSDPEEFIQNSRLEMYQDQVFCFSPKGNLIALPQGSTPVDFAYWIHSDVGNTCMGAKINGVIAPLRTLLKNGDQVEVICSTNQHPSETWEEFVVTGKAKTQIRKYIRSKKRETYSSSGKNLLTKFFHERKRDVSDKMLKNILHIFSKDSVEDLYVAVGEGLITKNDVFNSCYPDYKAEKNSKKLLSFFAKRKTDKSKNKAQKNSIDKTRGIIGVIPGMSIHFAGCCHPLPGDKIYGAVNSGKGVTVHQARCVNLKKISDKDNLIKLAWHQDNNLENFYTGRLRVIIANSFGSISKLTAEIAAKNINIANLKIIHKTENYYEIILDLELQNLKTLLNLKASLRSAKFIFSVERV